MSMKMPRSKSPYIGSVQALYMKIPSGIFILYTSGLPGIMSVFIENPVRLEKGREYIWTGGDFTPSLCHPKQDIL